MLSFLLNYFGINNCNLVFLTSNFYTKAKTAYFSSSYAEKFPCFQAVTRKNFLVFLMKMLAFWVAKPTEKSEADKIPEFEKKFRVWLKATLCQRKLFLSSNFSRKARQDQI